MPKHSRLPKSEKQVVRRALSHLREDIHEQKMGITKDKKTMKELRGLL